jgi:hypothetical protein
LEPLSWMPKKTVSLSAMMFGISMWWLVATRDRQASGFDWRLQQTYVLRHLVLSLTPFSFSAPQPAIFAVAYSFIVLSPCGGN